MSVGNVLLTVVVPVFNRERELAEMLESVRQQTSRDFALIIVDNASTDGSRAVAEAWALENKDIATIVLQESLPGAACARNRGLASVGTEWTLFFDSDDLMRPWHIAGVLEAIRNRRDVDVWGWNVAQTGYDHPVAVFAKRPTQWTNVMNGTFATERYCARTEIFRRAGAWNPGIGLWDDIELGARIMTLNPVIAKLEVPQPGVLVRFSEESITGSTFASQIVRMEPSLKAIETVLGAKGRFVADVKRTLFYGRAAREGAAEVSGLFGRVLEGTPSFSRRMALKFLFSTTRLGIRGTHLVLKFFYDR